MLYGMIFSKGCLFDTFETSTSVYKTVDRGSVCVTLYHYLTGTSAANKSQTSVPLSLTAGAIKMGGLFAECRR
jgi:hypothetical protein